MRTPLSRLSAALAATVVLSASSLPAQTVNVPATSAGWFGSPSDGSTDFVSGFQFTSSGQTIRVNASGTIVLGPGLSTGPNGTTVNRSVIIGPFGSAYTPLEEKTLDSGGFVPVSDGSSTVQNLGALIGAFVPASRVSSTGFAARDSDVAPSGNGIFSSELFLIGAGPYDFTAPGAGTLYFGINESYVSNNSGFFSVGVVVPEPTTVLAAALLAAVIIWFESRRLLRRSVVRCP